MSTRARINLAIVFFVALLIGAIWISVLEIVHGDRRETISAAIDRNDNLAIAFEEYTTRIMEGADDIIGYMIRDYHRSAGKFDINRFAADYTIANKAITDVVLVDENANIVTTAHQGKPAKPVNVADREHFKVHLTQNSGKLFVGKPVIGRVSGKSVIPITRRINKPDGSFGGVAIVMIEHSRFTDVLQDAHMRKLDIISLVGFDGITRARLRGTTPTTGEDISKSPLFKEHARNPVGHYAAPGQVDGVKRIFSYRSLPEYQLIATIGAAEPDVLAGHDRRKQQYFSIAGVASVLIAGFTLLLLVSLEKQRRATASLAEAQAVAKMGSWETRFPDLTVTWSAETHHIFETDATSYQPTHQRFLDFIHTDDRALVVAAFSGSLEDRLPHMIQHRIVMPDGRIKIVEERWHVFADGQGQPARAVGTCQDITDKKKAEQERAQLAAIVESSTDAIISRALDRTIISWNHAAEQMFGWTADEAIGKSVRIITPPEQVGLLEPLVQQVMQGEITAPVDTWRLRRDGSRFEAQIGFSAISDNDGKITAIATVIRDITKRREQEGILLKEKLFSDAMIESMPGIVYFYNEQRQFLRWNQNFSRVSGYSSEEIADMNPLDFFRNEDKPLLERKIREVFVRGDASVEADLLAKDGRTTHYFFTGKRIIFDGSACLIGMGIDISERKLAEAGLRDYAAQMRHLSSRLSEVEERERRNIHRELHDQVGANLAALKLDLGLINTMLAANTPEKISDRLQKAQQLTGETIARIRDVMADLRPPALDDYGLLAALRNYAQPYSARLGIPVMVNGNDIAPRLDIAVETALFRIVQEALNNITKHAQAGHVVITVTTTNDSVTLVVADDGTGFDVNHTDPRHAGWGLRTMHERAQAIAASFRVESSPGNGTRVIVELKRESA